MTKTKTERSTVVSGCESTGSPDYASVEIPAERPEEYSYVERRAEILQQVLEVGHPRALNQTELAERYGVSQQQISKDLDRLAEHVSATLGERRDLVTEAVMHRCIRELLTEGEWRDAARTVKDWNEWLYERRDRAEIAERLDRIEANQEREGRP